MNQQLSAKMPTAGLKLSLALMLALLIVPAYVVAPVLFAELTSAQAGLIAGKIFHVSNLAFLILCVAAALFARRLGVTKATWYLLLAVTLMVAINVFGVSTMMTMIKTEAGDISLLSKEEPLRWAFAFWHGLGSILQLLTSILVVTLVMKNHQKVPDTSELTAG